MHFPAIGMIARAIERRRDRAQIAKTVLSIQRPRSLIEHPLGHGVGVKAVDRFSGHVVRFAEIRARSIGATRAHEDELRLRLMVPPEGERIGVDLLVDDPLLARMLQTEVPGLSPRSKMEDCVMLLAGESVQVCGLAQVAVARIEARHRMTELLESLAQGCAEKARASRNEGLHTLTSD